MGRTGRYDELIVESWRTEPRLSNLRGPGQDDIGEGAEPLWKDLTLAFIAAVLLWIAAALALA